MGQAPLKEELDRSCAQYREPYEKCLSDQYQKWLQGEGYKEVECTQVYEAYKKCYMVMQLTHTFASSSPS